MVALRHFRKRIKFLHHAERMFTIPNTGYVVHRCWTANGYNNIITYSTQKMLDIISERGAVVEIHPRV